MPDATSDLGNTSKGKRRVWQFSLRALLLLPVVFAVLLALILLPIQRRRKLERLIARLEAIGGQVNLQNGRIKSVEFLPDKKTWHAKFQGFYSGPPPYTKGPAVSDEQLSIVRELADIESLRLAYTEIGDAGLRHLKGSTSLRELDAYRTPVTDDCMAIVGSLRNLERLNLSETAVGDAGLGRLTQLSELQRISLADTHITDDGLIHLARLRKLSSLDLTNTRVTDEGIRHLRLLGELGELQLGGTDVTDQSLEIIAAFPKLHSLSFWYSQERHTDKVDIRHSVSWPAIKALARSRPGLEITYTCNFLCRVDGDDVVFDAGGITITFENVALRSGRNRGASESENAGTLTVFEGPITNASSSWSDGMGMVTEVSGQHHGSDQNLTVAGQKLLLLPNGMLGIGDQVFEIGPGSTRILVTADGKARVEP
jgi:hypothetical protein